MRFLAPVAVLAALAGCANVDASKALRAVMLGQIEAWNAAGVDPIQLDERRLLYAATACGSLSAISTVWNPEAPSLSEEISSWCAAAVKAAAPGVE